MSSPFTIRKNSMLFWRLGNINSNRQTHFGKKGRQPPVSRGIWCFPYPFQDYFFVFHRWEEALPKKFRRSIGDNRAYDTEGMTDDEAQVFWEERERLLKQVKKRIRPSTFWYGGEFYSHINIHGKIYGEDWFLWDSVKMWATVASKTLWEYQRFGEEVEKISYTRDHLEIFIPNF